MVLMCIYNKKEIKKEKQGSFFKFFITQYYLKKNNVLMSLYLLDMQNKRTDSLMIAVIDVKGILMVSLNYPKRQ